MPTEIWTAEDLDNVRNGLAGSYIQMADIDLIAYDPWVPIDEFSGSYNGNNFNIVNLKTPNLFGGTGESITLENIHLFGDIAGNFNDKAFLLGEIYCWESGKTLLINNCHANGTLTSLGGRCNAGLIASIFPSENTVVEILGCTANVDIFDEGALGTQTGQNAGFVSYVDAYDTATVLIENCSCEGEISINGRINGGFVANTQGYDNSEIIYRNCHASGILHMDNFVQTETAPFKSSDSNGGFFGSMTSYGAVKSFIGCTASVNISLHDSRLVGGLGGYFFIAPESFLAQGCSATGDISITAGTRHDGRLVGGFAGGIESYNIDYPEGVALIEACFCTGDVSGAVNCGGFSGTIGVYGDDRSKIVQNCYARGSVTSLAFVENRGVGGFADMFDTKPSTLSIINCYHAGVINASLGGNENGFGRVSWEPVAIVNCYFDEDFSGATDDNASPRTTAEMVYPYTDKHVSGTYVDWGFENNHITDLTDYDFVFGAPWKHDDTFTLNDGYPQFEGDAPVDPTLNKLSDCITPSPPIFSISLNYGNFNSMVIEREEAKITQYRFINPETDLTLRTKWRYLTPKLEHNVECGFEVRGILIRYKVRGQKPRVRPED